MRVISKADTGVHFQKSELRNDYNQILETVKREDKLFIDDRNSSSVAVIISYGFYRKIVHLLEQLEELEDQADYKLALKRDRDGSEFLSSSEFKNLLKKV